jgi:DNA-binding XRE family transcriptional regulator
MPKQTTAMRDCRAIFLNGKEGPLVFKIRSGDNTTAARKGNIPCGYCQWFFSLRHSPPLGMNGRALLAWNLRKLRVEQLISQEKLAADAEIDRAYLGGLERQVENPTVDLLDKVAHALNVPLAELFKVPTAGESPPKPLTGGRKRAV